MRSDSHHTARELARWLASSVSAVAAAFALALVAAAAPAQQPGSAAPSAAGPAAIPAPPVAPARPVVDTLHGVPVTDRYRWMEDLKGAEVRDWIAAQGDYARRVFDAIPGRAALAARFRALDAATTAQAGLPQLAGGRLFYLLRRAGEEQGRLYVRTGLGGAPRLLVDPDARHHAPRGRHFAIDYFVPSPDGRYVAYGVSLGGSEEATLHVIDATTGRLTGDSITRAWFAAPSWAPDGRAFFYNRARALPPDAPATARYLASREFVHVLGRAADQDPVVFGIGVVPGIDVDSIAFPAVIADPSSRWAIALVGNGVQNELTLYTAPLSEAARPGARWRKVADTADAVVGFALHGADLYLLTHHDAPRYTVVRTPLADPDLAHATPVVPQSELVLQSLVSAGDALYVVALDAGLGRVLRVPYGGGAAQPIALPFDGSVQVAADPLRPGLVLGLTSWTRAWRYLAWDPSTRRFRRTTIQPVGPNDDPPDLVSEEVRVPAADGTSIPLSIFYERDTPRDGSAPAYLSGYGAYGISLLPSFDPLSLAYLERGLVRAVCHVRGGGELGEEWHRAGMKATKPNTWNDFIACAEYLVKNRYTSAARLAGTGTSAGGILIGRAITARPDLFVAAVDRVGDSDALRSEFMESGPANIPEFGTQRDSAGFAALHEMDAYQHVTDGTRYPAVLLTTGLNDPRVAPWQAAKMTARLQAATTSGRPVLLRVERDAGHGIGSARSQILDELTDTYAFLFWQFGDPEFQPRNLKP